MDIIEYNKKYKKFAINLLTQLQQYIVKIDKYNLNILSKDYGEVYFKKTYKQCYRNGGKIFIAILDNKPVGLIAGFIEKYSKFDKLDYKCPKKAIISELVVEEKARLSGIGQALLEHIQEYFKGKNCEFCQIDVFAYNDIAKKFYQKNAFNERMITLFKKL